MPGESQQLTFRLSAMDLASFDDEGAAWIADTGNYRISVGASSRDLRTNASFTLDSDITVVSHLVDLSPAQNPDKLPH